MSGEVHEIQVLLFAQCLYPTGVSLDNESKTGENDFKDYFVIPILMYGCGFGYIMYRARFKQNKYPVMFLTQGVTKKYPEYLDARTKNIEAAINFANSADLLVSSVEKMFSE